MALFSPETYDNLVTKAYIIKLKAKCCVFFISKGFVGQAVVQELEMEESRVYG